MIVGISDHDPGIRDHDAPEPAITLDRNQRSRWAGIRTHGAADLEGAIAEALEHGSPHLAAVRQILDQRRHQRGQPPPIPVRLPDDPRLSRLAVRPHALTDYEQLQQEGCDDDHDDDSGIGDFAE